MVGLSHTAGYAIRALSCLSDSVDLLQTREIADRARIPLHYLSQIMHSLRDSGLIESKRGYRGGYRLTRPSTQIALLDVIEAVNGPDWLTDCLLWFDKSSAAANCPTHEFWTGERKRIKDELAQVTLADVASFQGKNLHLCRGEGEGI